ncbi:MAG: serine/threonine-protein kinase [Solirubrobacteraceae bacterium]
MTARSAAHLVIGAICNFSLTCASPACEWQGAPLHRRTQESVDSHDTLIAPGRGPCRIEARTRDARPAAGWGAPVLGRYRLLERLGAGGFGVVWSAHDELLNREVAVKVIALPAGEDRERATREALATARLAHPAIVALYEACAEHDTFYLISELVHGETLARLIAADLLCDEETIEIGIALADALLHAHGRGVIHRDIKPQNVLVPARADPGRPPERLGAAPVAKLTDFGGALLAGEEPLTRTGDVLGTLAYMAPEQIDGEEVGTGADLYSLALVLYEALSGVNPVRGATPAATARRIGERLPPLERQRRDLPRELTAALDQALEADPELRGTLPELSAALTDGLRDGLRRSHWGRRARIPAAPLPHPFPFSSEGPDQPPSFQPSRAPLVATEVKTHGHAPQDSAEERPDLAGWLTATRLAWIAATMAACVWQIASGHPGVAPLILCAALPLVLLVRRPGSHWLAALLAPALGLVGLAGAFPAIAGQLARWRSRALLGALGYWWLRLAELPLDGSVASTTHALAHLLSVALLLGVALWGLAAAVLPWLVRGRSAMLDALAAILWAVALVAGWAGVQALDRGLPLAGATLPSPHGVILSASLGALLAVAARALRGPVRTIVA